MEADAHNRGRGATDTVRVENGCAVAWRIYTAGREILRFNGWREIMEYITLEVLNKIVADVVTEAVKDWRRLCKSAMPSKHCKFA